MNISYDTICHLKDYRKQQKMSDNEVREQLISNSGEKFTSQEPNYAIQHLND